MARQKEEDGTRTQEGEDEMTDGTERGTEERVVTEEGHTNTSRRKGEVCDEEERRNGRTAAYYEYRLMGVLVHSGGADAGHYYSYVRDRTSDTRWLEFNDDRVVQFHPEV